MFKLLWPMMVLITAVRVEASMEDMDQKPLKPCPDSPNCVCSMYEKDEHYVKAISYKGEKAHFKQLLLKVIAEMPRTKVVNDSANHLHVEFTSAIFRFVDDVEFYFDNDENVVHVRSASRSGYYDFGVNRSRIEKIRNLVN